DCRVSNNVVVDVKDGYLNTCAFCVICVRCNRVESYTFTETCCFQSVNCKCGVTNQLNFSKCLHTPTVKWLTFQTSYFVCVNHLETEVDVRRNSGCLFRNRNCKDVIKCTSLQAEILFRSRPDEVCTLYNVKSHYATLVSITYIVAVCKFGVKCVFFQHCLCNVRSCQNYTRISVEHAVDKTGAPNNCASYCVVCMSISHNVTVTQRCVQIVNKCTVCAVFGCCDCFDVVTTVQCSVCVVSDNFRQNRRRTVFNNALCKT